MANFKPTPSKSWFFVEVPTHTYLDCIKPCSRISHPCKGIIGQGDRVNVWEELTKTTENHYDKIGY
jgi:hypothetical protein